MKTRRNQILGGLIVLQLLIVAAMYVPRSGNVETITEPLLPNLANDATRIVIEDADGKTLTLAKEGGEWVLLDADHYPADKEKAAELLDKAGAVTRKRLVARTRGSRKQLKVAADDFERKVEFDVGGERTAYIGSSVGARSSHIRLDGDDNVYLANDLASWQIETSVTSWIDTEYFNVEKDDIVSVAIKNDNGTFEFEKDHEGAWTMAGLGADEQFDDGKLTTLLNRVSPLRMTKPLGKEEKPAYGIGNPAAVVTIRTERGDETNKATKTYTLHVGRPASDEDNFVVRSSESLYYVEASRWNVRDFAEHGRDDFLVSDGS